MDVKDALFMPMHYAIDFESEYSDEVSATTMGAHNYALATNIFLVGIYSPDVEYVGPLKGAPWPSGQHWVSHNASFDETLFYVAKSRGLIRRAVRPSRWSCTADLSAYCLLGRALADAAKHGLGVTPDKALRQRVKNKSFEDLKPSFKADFDKYCLSDAKYSWQLWEQYSAQWPEEEQEFAQVIRKRCREGIVIDFHKLESFKTKVFALRESAATKLPWGKPYLAVAQVRNYCGLLGIDPPQSLAEDDPRTEAWENKYVDRSPIIKLIRSFRKSNILLRKIEAMERRIMPNGRMFFSLKYHGAGATGRLSGADGLNIQNLNREPYEGVDLRRLLIAGEGQKFLIADYAQIEPRITAWVTGNSKFLSQLSEGVSFYEVDARASRSWNGEPGTFKKSDPNGYQAQKAQSLGIGYGMGAKRFCKAAKDQLGVLIDPWEAKTIIAGWHYRNPGVRSLWNQLEGDLKLSHFRREPYILTLPSGRSLTYMDVSTKTDVNGLHYTAKNSHSSGWQYYWGGSLFENLIQATARDILRDAVIACERAGIPVRFSAHDEIVAEVPQGFDSKLLKEIMCTPPDWAKGLPLDVEIIESGEYLK